MGVLILSVCLSFLVANSLGSKRQIGYGWSLFFCLTLTIVGGLIVTLLSRKYQPDNTTPPSRVKIVIGWILIIFYSLSIIGNCIRISDSSPESREIIVKMLSLAVGFIGLGIYLIKLGKSKNFNTKITTLIDE